MVENPPTPPEQSGSSAHHGLRVGAYEGMRAGEAIVAVREGGLRPSLERVEGYAERRQGFVVSQEPAAGCEVAAESQVFLYIGAPARARAGAGIVGEGEAVASEPAGDGLEAFADGEDWAEPELIEEEPEPEKRPESVGAPGGGGRRRGLGTVPVGVKVAAAGLVACAVVTLLVSLAASLDAGRAESRAGVSAAAGVASGPAVARGARGRRPAAVATKRVVPVGRRVHRRRKGERAREREVVRVVVVREAAGAIGAGVAAAGGLAAPGDGEALGSDEARAEREFGP